MCRLYGFRATEPTKVECTLVHSQNALMAQSRRDLAGEEHGHGWGIATYEDHEPHVERQAWAAYHGEHFARAAARVYPLTALAHIRKATVGEPRMENTHPFSHGRWAFAHNGTVPHFAELRERFRREIAPAHLAAIAGETDSEHVFRYALTLMERDGAEDLLALVRRVVENVVGWCRARDAEARIGLNIMLTDGQRMAGSRLGRTLSYIERDRVYDCEICGFPHIHHQPSALYRAVVVASEPLTHEAWSEIREGSLWQIDARSSLRIEPL